MRNQRRLAAVVVALAVLPALGAAIGNSAIATTQEEARTIQQSYYTPAPAPQWSSIEIAIRQAEERKAKARSASLQSYLAGHGSPLAPFASDFIKAGDTYGVDYRIVVAISGREQTFGAAWPGPSNNFWGYGGYRWPDVSTAIWEYTRLLSQEYPGLCKGDIYGSASRYAESPTWASGVSEFYGEMLAACP